jgi:hypothetical protein
MTSIFKEYKSHLFYVNCTGGSIFGATYFTDPDRVLFFCSKNIGELVLKSLQILEGQIRKRRVKDTDRVGKFQTKNMKIKLIITFINVYFLYFARCARPQSEAGSPRWPSPTWRKGRRPTASSSAHRPA